MPGPKQFTKKERPTRGLSPVAYLFFVIILGGCVLCGLLGKLLRLNGCQLLRSRVSLAGILDFRGLGFVVAVDTGDHGHLVILDQAHDADTTAVAALGVDVRRMDADQDAVLADLNQIIGVVHDLDARHVAVGVVADA